MRLVCVLAAITTHDVPLIATIAVSLAFAFVGGLLAVRLRLPPLVGYLLAGIVVGPFTPGFVADAKLAPQLAEIGVILLMFGVGTHFSIRDLVAVRRVALPGAFTQILVATALGAGVATLWGWSLGAGIIFGLSLSVASTVVLLRALEDRDMVKSNDGRIAIGWLVVEDLLMVLTLVLLPLTGDDLLTPAIAERRKPLAGARNHDRKGRVIHRTDAYRRCAIFPVAFIARGKNRLARIVHSRSDRACPRRGVWFCQTLWRFLCPGRVLCRSGRERIRFESPRQRRDLQPLQDAFSLTVLFFVAVGMLFDPSILIRQPLQVLAVLAIVVFGKSLAAFGIVRVLGGSMRTALIVSAALAQIGEFSFILAGLGVNLRLLPAEGLNLIVAGALLSITFNPAVFSAAIAFAGREDKRRQEA